MEHEIATKNLTACLHSQIKWNLKENGHIQGLVYNATNSNRQIFLGRGTGWSTIRTPISHSHIANRNQIHGGECVQIIKSRRIRQWQGWWVVNKTEVIPIKKRSIHEISESKHHRHVGRLVDSLLGFIEERNPGEEYIELPNQDGEAIWLF